MQKQQQRPQTEHGKIEQGQVTNGGAGDGGASGSATATGTGAGGEGRKSGMSWVWGMTGGMISRFTNPTVPNANDPTQSREGGVRNTSSAPHSKGNEVGGGGGSGSKKKKKTFWTKRKTSLPGTVKQVRGAQYPPLTVKGQLPVLTQPEWKKRPLTQPSLKPNKAVSSSSGNNKNTAVVSTPSPSANPTLDVKNGSTSNATTATSTITPPGTHNSNGSDDKKEQKKSFSSPSSVGSSNALSKRAQIFKLINEPTLDISALRQKSWSGLCPAVRNDAWQLILGYQPANRERRGPTIKKRRKEYQDHCRNHYSTDEDRLSSSEKKIMHQIRLDTPRTLPGVKLLQHPSIQLLLERILFIWSIRHPASGYVQGMNDLVVPFLVVYLASRAGVEPSELEQKHLQTEHLRVIEADCFWSLSKLLDGIQDHYTSAQPGIQRMVFKLEELIHRIDQPLHDHLKKHDIRFFHFSYRWMNCLLMREVSLPLIIRVWDTYIAEPDGFKVFHIYVCASMLKTFSSDLIALDEFQDLIVYLQNLPTQNW
eukprot:CAMPEP_0197523256 /NCGR_PEP_ID=MMETSP1318-20131121/8230_1 /TAXON_ID=552666 /ORGANISM="Partenskyella glossopodia, Strain RCC365" /LENGTH=536 /DNA_ID=CAMNT_0043075891 /DNA_START=336 /DNA_END=1943 /DNA_ORIENTATION=-